MNRLFSHRPLGRRHRPLAPLLIALGGAWLACSDGETTGPQPPPDPIPLPAGTWDAVQSMPAALYDFAAAVYRGQIYVLGGFDDALETKSTVYRYDPTLDQWTQLSDLPDVRALMPAVVVADTLYVAGGFVPGTGGAFDEVRASFWAYLPDTDQWVARTAMPEPNGQSGGAEVGGEFFVVGGTEDPVDNQLTQGVLAFDPSTQSWRTGAAIPTPRRLVVVEAVGTRIYALGGTTGVASGLVEIYDTGSDSWSTGTQTAVLRVNAASAVLGGAVHVISGGTVLGAPTSSHLAYLPATDEWGQYPNGPRIRSGGRAVTLGGQIYVIGGLIAQGIPTAAVDRFTP